MNFFKERRGFAAMSEDKQRAISSKGGKAAHVKGTAHQFSAEEARRAGRLGGEAVSQNSRRRRPRAIPSSRPAIIPRLRSPGLRRAPAARGPGPALRAVAHRGVWRWSAVRGVRVHTSF
jgi:hypothetical protein